MALSCKLRLARFSVKLEFQDRVDCGNKEQKNKDKKKEGPEKPQEEHETSEGIRTGSNSYSEEDDEIMNKEQSKSKSYHHNKEHQAIIASTMDMDNETEERRKEHKRSMESARRIYLKRRNQRVKPPGRIR